MNKQEQIEEMVKDYKCCIACEMYNKYASHPYKKTMSVKYQGEPLYKNIVTEIDIKPFDFTKEALKIATEVQYMVTEEIVKNLYNIFKHTDLNKVYIIDKKEFMLFLEKYLPIYAEERRKRICEIEQANKLFRGEDDE